MSLTAEQRDQLERAQARDEEGALRVIRAVAARYPAGHEPLRREIVERLTRGGICFSAAWRAHEVLERLEAKGAIRWGRGRTRGRDRLLLSEAE
jgi:hypothetical protein